MSIIDRLEKFKIDSKELPDIEYLKKPEIGGVISKGLAELYKVQPKNPITFLSNWLLNESRSYKIKNHINEMNMQKQELITKFSENQIKLNEENKTKAKEVLIKENERKDFHKLIMEAQDFDPLLGMICQKLKEFTNATGVYIAIKDLKRKKVTDNDDESAHLVNDVEVIRYIAYDKDHEKILKGKYLELDTGVTNDLFKPPEETEEKKNDEIKNEEGGNEEKKVEEEKLKPLRIDEVVREKRMKFFREPRLGCYRAIDITYKSSLIKNSLDSAIDCKKEYDQKVIEAENKRKEKEEDMKKLQDEANANQENKENADPNNPVVPIEQPEEEKVLLTDFLKFPKRYIICMDTMGQDRLFSTQEEEFALATAKILRNSWEELEKRLLLKDRDIRFEMMKQEKIYLDQNPLDKMPDLEDKFKNEYIQEKFINENPQPSEQLIELYRSYAKAKFLLKSILEDEILKGLVINFNQMDVVEYEILFQNILYFVGIPNTSINEDETNKLQWKKAKKHWKIEVLTALKTYQPFGPKGKVNSFAMINRLIPIFNPDSFKNIENYSICLARLLEFMQIILSIRKEDIIRRRKLIDEENNKTDELAKKKEAQDLLRQQFLEDAKKESDDKGEEFNRELVLEDFNIKNAPIITIIPNKINYDVDDDFLIDT